MPRKNRGSPNSWYEDPNTLNRQPVDHYLHREMEAPSKRDVSTFELHWYVKQQIERIINTETETKLVTEN